jgi:hypothetical protein
VFAVCVFLACVMCMVGCKIPQFYPLQVLAGVVPAWIGYEHTFISMDSIHTLHVKSSIGYGYSLLPTGIPISYPY